MSKYHIPSRATSLYIWFKLLDKNGKVLRDYGMQGCYGSITYQMDTKTETIQVYRAEGLMPYNFAEVKRWIDDITDAGFPCELIYDPDATSDEMRQEKWAEATAASKKMKEIILAFREHGLQKANPYNDYVWGKPGPQNYKFNVHLKDYANKSHLFSTLTLIRMLSESSMSTVPEIYFNMMDADPLRDKFEAIQEAHRGPVNGGSHAVTYKGNGKSITREAIMKKFKAKNNLRDGRIAIHAAWQG